MEIKMKTTSEFIARFKWELVEDYQRIMPHIYFAWYEDELIIHYPLIGRDDDNQLLCVGRENRISQELF